MCCQYKILKFLLLLVCFIVPFVLFGQKAEKRAHPGPTLREGVPDTGYSWSLFVEEYLQSLAENDEETTDANTYLQGGYVSMEDFEEIHRHPIPVNVASREDLQRIGFLSDEQIDEILDVRDRRKGGYTSLGELMTVYSLSYRDRAWLSLLLDFSTLPSDSLLTGNATRRRTLKLAENRWRDGSHEILANMSVPLQQQAGFYDYDADNYHTRMFTGYPFAHSLKYRYNWRHRLRYGATVEEDAGERWGAYGGKPWDFSSLHFYYRSSPVAQNGNRFSKFTLTVGDYRISIGQGLAVSSSMWGQFSSLMSGFRQESVRLSPHVGNDESNFFRGMAAHVRLGSKGQWAMTAFASWRKKDGTVKGANLANDYSPSASDTITAWKTDGLHRTLQEIKKRHVADQLVGGARFGYQNRWINVGFDATSLYYNKVYCPAPRAYNKYYMSGQHATTLGADYALKLGKWAFQGELQMNPNGAYASTSVLRWQPQRSLLIVLQHRSFSHDFVSPLGQTVQAGSQIQNEEGTLLGFRYNGPRRLVVMGYADYAYHRHPVYLADTASHRMQAMLQCGFRSSAAWSHSLQYKLKTRQQNVSGYKQVAESGDVLMAWRTTQHVRWQSSFVSNAWSTTLGADGALYYSQGNEVDKDLSVTPVKSFGGLLFCRSSYAFRKRLKASVMGAAFLTDDYNTRCYAYVPQLRGRSIGFPMFYGKGLMGNCLADVNLWRGLSAGASVNVTKYFDRETIGSGVNRIEASVKAEVMMQVRWVT